MTSHDSVCMLHARDVDADVTLTLYLTAGDRVRNAEYLCLRQQARTRRSIQRRPPSIRR
jgi:hypothetical protein